MYLQRQVLSHNNIFQFEYPDIKTRIKHALAIANQKKFNWGCYFSKALHILHKSQQQLFKPNK